MTDIETRLIGCADEIENKLSEYVPMRDTQYALIYDAMRYSLLAGGKRLRPFLVMEFARLAASDLGADQEAAKLAAMPYACAVEMIHTYSLIHDDLPCMDNDDLRRGKPTSHKVYGEANALLAGDALLTLAFGVTASNAHASAETNCKAAALLAECAGASGMIGGQVLDLLGEGTSFGFDTLEQLQTLKTGELIRCAALLGCYAGGGDDELVKAAQSYASSLGRAFQVVDDILDMVGDEATLGKPIGSDQKSDKTTFVSVMGIDAAREYAAKLTEHAKAEIRKYKNSETLCALAEYLLTRVK